MHMAAGGMPGMEKLTDASMLMMKTKRGSIHEEPCGPVYPHVPAYSPPSVYVNPYIQQAYLKKELGVAQSHQSHLSQVAPTYTTVLAKPSITYVKPAVDYHQSVQYVKPAAPIYQKPMLSYAPIYQKPLYYAPMYQESMYRDYAMPSVFLKKYETPQVAPVYQKLHAPAVQYAAPKVIQVQPPQVSYVKPALASPSPPVYVSPLHNSVIVKPHCA